MSFYDEWNDELKNKIKILEEENNLIDDSVYTNLIEYIKTHNNRFIDIKPIKYFYATYYPENIVKKQFKICDLTFEYLNYYSIPDIDVRDEIKYKLILESLYNLNKNIIEKKFNVKLVFELEGVSDIYRECRDNFINDINEDNQYIISNCKKYRQHDVLLSIIDNSNNKYQIGCEFNETHHTKEYDSNRKITSKIPLMKLFIRKQETKETMIQHIKNIMRDIIFKCCAINNDKTFIAKLLMTEKLSDENYEMEYDMISLLLNCFKNDCFKFSELYELFQFRVSEQDEIKEFLIENNILNNDDSDDPNLATYQIDDDGEYFFDEEQFAILMSLITDDISDNYKKILRTFLRSQKALLEAADLLLEKERSNRIDQKNLSSFINEITSTGIKQLKEKYENEIEGLKCYKKIFEELQKYNHCSKKILPYIKYKKGCQLNETDMYMIKYILGNNYNKLLSKTIETLNEKNPNNKIIYNTQKDKTNENMILLNAVISAEDLFNYHYIK